jgi:hypothetical protein
MSIRALAVPVIDAIEIGGGVIGLGILPYRLISYSLAPAPQFSAAPPHCTVSPKIF